MEVKNQGRVCPVEDYKTESVPIGWRHQKLGDAATFRTGPFGSALHRADYIEDGVPLVNPMQISAGGIEPTNGMSVSEEAARRLSDFRLRSGDVVIGRRGEMGRCAYVHESESGWLCGTGSMIVRCQDDLLNGDFAQRLLSSPAIVRAIEAASVGTTMTNLNQRTLSQLRLLVPAEVGEQNTIAEALSDADVLIKSLSLLLVKKRQIKQGAMQELLTGKRRLPGFQGRWIECPFNSIAALRRERISPHLMATPPWCIELEHINSGSGRLEGQGFESVQAATKTVFVRGDVLFGKLRAYLRKYWLAEFDGVCSTEIWALRPTGVLKSNEYLFYTVQRDDLIEAASSSYGTHMPRSDWNVLGAFLLNVPEDVAEQRGIAEVLSDMDAAIAATDARLAKARDIKQAMTQELLTGRIRLVQPGSNVISLPVKAAASSPSPSQPPHNWQINEAVVIGVLARRFGNEKMPLGRKRRVKLMYLLHRHAEGRAEGYLKKAAGPYDPNTKYRGPEAIALKNGYVRAVHNGKYEGFMAGDKSDQAQRYFEQWYGKAALDWLERFHYRKTEELELLATVDMAMVDLAATSQSVDVAGVKSVIAAHPEWLPKLSRELFSDEGIQRAFVECAALFPA